MLAKETGITVLVVNVAYDVYKMWPQLNQLLMHCLSKQSQTTSCSSDQDNVPCRWRKRWTEELRLFALRTAVSGLFIVIFCAARMAIGGSLPKFSQQDNPAAFHSCVVTRFLTFSYLAAFNWWLLLCPTTLSHDWQMSSIKLITRWADARNLLTVLIVLLLLGLVFRAWGDFKVSE